MTLGSRDAPPRAGLSGLEPSSPPAVAPALSNIKRRAAASLATLHRRAFMCVCVRVCVCSCGGGDLSRLTAAGGKVCRLTFVSSAAHTDVAGTSTVKYIPLPTPVLFFPLLPLLSNMRTREKIKGQRTENNKAFERGNIWLRPVCNLFFTDILVCSVCILKEALPVGAVLPPTWAR